MRKIASILLAVFAVGVHAASPEPIYFGGTWVGKMQYKASIASKVDQASYAVVDFTFFIDENGGVRGSSPENGCQIAGLASLDHYRQEKIHLDLNVSQCAHKILNTSVKGGFVIDRKTGFAAMEAGIIRPIVGGLHVIEMKANLRRG